MEIGDEHGFRRHVPPYSGRRERKGQTAPLIGSVFPNDVPGPSCSRRARPIPRAPKSRRVSSNDDDGDSGGDSGGDDGGNRGGDNGDDDDGHGNIEPLSSAFLR